jgi:cytochrome c-type biogenesis protein CcmH
MLLIAIIIILVLVIVALTSPFWRKDPDPVSPFHHDNRTEELADLAIEREVLVRSIQELDVELEQGRLESDDHIRLKATDERRLLQVLDRLEDLQVQAAEPQIESADATSRKRNWLPATVCTVAVLLASIGIYGFVLLQAKQKFDRAQSEMGQGGPNPLEMVARLEERLRENPDDLQGQIMSGRSYLALERFEEAIQAWTKVLELDPRNHEAHFNLGVILIERRKFDDPKVFNVALGHFDTVLVDQPNQPGVNWYRGVALWYLNRHREAEDAWATAFNNLDPASQDAVFVKEALQKLRAGETPF